MNFLTGYQIELIVANLANFALVVFILASATAFVVRGFTRYPWPDWARRKQNR